MTSHFSIVACQMTSHFIFIEAFYLFLKTFDFKKFNIKDSFEGHLYIVGEGWWVSISLASSAGVGYKTIASLLYSCLSFWCVYVSRLNGDQSYRLVL